MEGDWPWFFPPSTNKLYRKGNDTWESFPVINNRNHLPSFSIIGEGDTVPEDLHQATVYRKGNSFICSGHGTIQHEAPEQYSTFAAYLNRQQYDQWYFEYMLHIDNSLNIAIAIQNQTAIAVSDGSYKQAVGTAAVIIHDGHTSYNLQSTLVTPGRDVDHSSYRS